MKKKEEEIFEDIDLDFKSLTRFAALLRFQMNLNLPPIDGRFDQRQSNRNKWWQREFIRQSISLKWLFGLFV